MKKFQVRVRKAPYRSGAMGCGCRGGPGNLLGLGGGKDALGGQDQIQRPLCVAGGKGADIDGRKARTQKCARSLCEMASKIIERGASMSQRMMRMAWRCGEVVVQVA